MAELAQGVWILVADGEKALFLRNLTDHADPNFEVVSEREERNPPTSAQGTDRPGRYNDGPTVMRSAVEETDWHRLAEDRFADDLAEMLYQRAHRGAFDRIVLVAAPRVLGELRRVMHKEVADRVVAEIDKDLTNHPIDGIERVVKAALDAG
jgi:protein required for attachment to host cells